MKCLIILSEKSSGSSACQNLLTAFPNVKCVSKTRHYENETLYWTKAASILGLPQRSMVDSEVPFAKNRARNELIKLLTDNLGHITPPGDDRELIFGGWKQLCSRFAPVFLEKSPHHLIQTSALDLILECMERMPEVEFYVIGLIRNPMDTIYSQFDRWRTRPERLQYQWLVAYKNLQALKPVLGSKLFLLRYEDMVSSPNCMQPVFDFCGLQTSEAAAFTLHQKSLSRWKTDRLFGFALSDEVIELAQGYGYSLNELVNTNRSAAWPPYREVTRLAYRSVLPFRNFFRKSVKNLAGADLSS